MSDRIGDSFPQPDPYQYQFNDKLSDEQEKLLKKHGVKDKTGWMTSDNKTFQKYDATKGVMRYVIVVSDVSDVEKNKVTGKKDLTGRYGDLKAVSAKLYVTNPNNTFDPLLLLKAGDAAGKQLRASYKNQTPEEIDQLQKKLDSKEIDITYSVHIQNQSIEKVTSEIRDTPEATRALEKRIDNLWERKKSKLDELFKKSKDEFKAEFEQTRTNWKEEQIKNSKSPSESKFFWEHKQSDMLRRAKIEEEERKKRLPPPTATPPVLKPVPKPLPSTHIPAAAPKPTAQKPLPPISTASSPPRPKDTNFSKTDNSKKSPLSPTSKPVIQPNTSSNSDPKISSNG